MTDQMRPIEPPGSSGTPWSAGPPPGYPSAPPVGPAVAAAAVAPYEPPPEFSAPPYGSGPVPVAPPGPWTWPSPGGPWGAHGADPAWATPGPPPPPPPGSVFWPKTIAWMGLDRERARWGIPDVLLGLIAFFVGSFLAGGAVVAVGAAALGGDVRAFVDDYAGAVAIASLFGSWAAVVGFLLLISRLKGTGSLRRDFGFSFSWWDPLIGLGAAIVTLFISGVLQLIIAAFTGAPPASNTDAIFGDVADNTALLLIMAACAAVGAPLVEELLFRGLALRAIEKRFNGIVAVIGSSVLFGVLHFQWGTEAPLALIAGISVYGLVFAVLTRWWSRTGPAVCAHVWINSIATAVVLGQALVG